LKNCRAIFLMKRIIYTKFEGVFTKIGGVNDTILIVNDEKFPINYDKKSVNRFRKFIQQIKNGCEIEIVLISQWRHCEGFIETFCATNNLPVFRCFQKEFEKTICESLVKEIYDEMNSIASWVVLENNKEDMKLMKREDRVVYCLNGFGEKEVKKIRCIPGFGEKEKVERVVKKKIEEPTWESMYGI